MSREKERSGELDIYGCPADCDNHCTCVVDTVSLFLHCFLTALGWENKAQ